MRWKPKVQPDEWVIIAMLLLMSPLLLPGAIAVGAYVCVRYCKRWLIGPGWEWSPWFAWYPVTPRSRNDHIEEQTVWLEWIERRLVTSESVTYRTREMLEQEAGEYAIRSRPWQA